jgi:hypothetical protein
MERREAMNPSEVSNAITAAQFITAQLAECRAILTRPGFRCRTDAERKASLRRGILEDMTGDVIPEPPPCEESQFALAELLEDLRRLEADAADLRK